MKLKTKEDITEYTGINKGCYRQFDSIWFRDKTTAEILKYANQRKAIRDHVDPDDRARFDELYGGNESFPLLHSPREIISTAGKTGHDARGKRKQS